MKDKIEQAIDRLVEDIHGTSFQYPWIVGKYPFQDWVENLKTNSGNETMVIVNTDQFDPAGKNIAIMGADSTPEGTEVYIKRDTFSSGYVWMANGRPCKVVAHVPETLEMLKKYNVSKARLYFFD